MTARLQTWLLVLAAAATIGAVAFASSAGPGGSVATFPMAGVPDANETLVGQKHGKVTFRIAEKAPIGVPTTVRADPGGHPKGEQRFKSTSLRPLTLKINKLSSKAAPGDLFVALKAGAGQDGPVI